MHIDIFLAAYLLVVLVCFAPINGEETIKYEASQEASTYLSHIRLAREATDSEGAADPTFVPPTKVYEENHKYYNKKVLVSRPRALQFREVFDSVFSKSSPKYHGQLDNSHKIAVQLNINFDFPFYGHNVNKITIATGGFLYLNDFLHPYIAHAQYVAPLMANFDTLHSDSKIRWVDTGTDFWVRWENLFLHHNRSQGNFTFQCALFQNGSIMFDYLQVPVDADTLLKESNNLHYVKSGLSDAYYEDTTDTTTGNTIRRIYRYHTVAVDLKLIEEDTIVEFYPLPTCNRMMNCVDCVNKTLVPHFTCSWCVKLNRCSSGLDRDKQKWENNRCHENDVKTVGNCKPNTKIPVPDKEKSVGVKASSIVLGIFITILIVLVIGCVVFFFVYAYRNPTSSSGMWLMEHRPARLRERIHNIRIFKTSSSSAGDNYKISVDEPAAEYSYA